MLNRLLAVLVLLLLGVGSARADEATGKLKEVAADKITIAVDGKDVVYNFAFKDLKVFDGDKEVKAADKGKFLIELKKETEVKVTYNKDGNKATELRVKK